MCRRGIFRWLDYVGLQQATIWLWLTVRHGKSTHFIANGNPSISMGHGLTMANCNSHNQRVPWLILSDSLFLVDHEIFQKLVAAEGFAFCGPILSRYLRGDGGISDCHMTFIFLVPKHVFSSFGLQTIACSRPVELVCCTRLSSVANIKDVAKEKW